MKFSQSKIYKRFSCNTSAVIFAFCNKYLDALSFQDPVKKNCNRNVNAMGWRLSEWGTSSEPGISWRSLRGRKPMSRSVFDGPFRQTGGKPWPSMDHLAPPLT